MILIISSPEDVSTNDVIHWLRYLNISFLRIYQHDLTEIEQITIDNGVWSYTLIINGRKVSSNDIKSVWYRRSFLYLKQLPVLFPEDESIQGVLNRQMIDELGVTQDFLLSLFETKSLNSQRHISINKPEVLAKCAKLGIKTPPTLITTSKTEVQEFKVKYNSIISKNIAPGAFLQMKEFTLRSNTMLVTDEHISEMPDRFMVSLFQEAVEKSFEVRSFYLDGEFFSTAIFSQNDEQTKIDFRNYNFEKPNRTPPFELPYELRASLDKLMKELNLNSGSIDLMVTENGDYVFLEVNPVGQFAQVSTPCNYNLEKKVALYLNT